MSTVPQDQSKAAREGVSRRRALARLGLAAGVAYAAPTVTNLDRRAYAQATPCPPRQGNNGNGNGKGQGKPGCR
mgnify:CR=1 FL=1